VTIDHITPGSLAAKAGLEQGDSIIKINGKKVRDWLDYCYATAGKGILLTVKKKNGEQKLLRIIKDEGEDLGLGFNSVIFDRLMTCHNHCIFCFVDQMPQGTRKTLNIKDDDYRLSFLQGNFITLTNLTAKDLQRITKQKISPLYISVHATDPIVRVKMLRNRKAGLIMKQLKQLAAAGIKMHTQIVLCPGINDQKILDRTIRDLGSLYPSVLSVAVVPVGLTKFRTGLYPLRLFSQAESIAVIQRVEQWQAYFRQKFGSNFVYLADEFYLNAAMPIPPASAYDDFPQTENGVGLIRLFQDEFNHYEKELPTRISPPRKVTVATGVSAAKFLTGIIKRLNEIRGLNVQLEVIENHYLGPTVTVAGLITGTDLLINLKDKILGEVLIIPAIMLKQDEQIFLDDISLETVRQQLGVRIKPVDSDAYEFIKAVLDG